MAIETVRRLYDHLVWADRGTLEALTRAGTPLRRTLELYAHLLGTEHVWLARLERRAPAVEVWPDLTLEGCRTLAHDNEGAYARFLSGLDDEALSRAVHYTNSAGRAFDSTIEDILVHVALHGAYHRGQIALLVRDAGAEPVPTDYIAFVRGVPAATRRRG